MRYWPVPVLCALILLGGAGSSEARVPPSFAPLSPEAEEALTCRACGLFLQDRLPAGSALIPDRAVCGTPIVLELASNWHRLRKATQETYAAFFLRPSTQKTVISPKGHFQIHYNTTGSHAVDAADADRNGVPDYVDEVAETFDYIWTLQIDGLGYHAPPSDGDSYYDIYIQNLAVQSAYGFTYPESFQSTATSSYMEIDNNYTDAIYETRGIDGLHVTAAHEFFHSIQFGYYADFDAAWWQEMTAVWMEDVAYDELNDYYQYLGDFFTEPHISLDRFNRFGYDLHPFGAAVYVHHLEQVYGAESVRTVWEVLEERRPSPYRLDVIDAGMPMGGFAGVLPRFAVWNYFTGARTLPGYYTEAGDYPKATAISASPRQGMPTTGSHQIDHLGAGYIRVSTSGLSGGLRGAFTLDGGTSWTLLVLLVSDTKAEIIWAGDSPVEIPNVQRYNEIVFVPISTSLDGKGFTCDYAISLDAGIRRASPPVGDFDDNGRVNFADFVSFAGGYGRKPAAEGHNQRLDINGDGEIDFQDFLSFASHFGE